jgi:hypothetical protein
MSQQHPTTMRKHQRGTRGSGRLTKSWRSQIFPPASNSFKLQQVPAFPPMVSKPPAIPTFASDHFSPSTEVQVPVSTSNVSVLELLAPSTEVPELLAPSTEVPELLAPSTEVCVNVPEQFAPPTGVNFVSERIAPPTRVCDLFTPPTASLPSCIGNLAMLAKREAMVHLALSRAHSIYSETLTDVPMPQLDKRSCLHHVEQDRTTSVPTNVPALHELPLIHHHDDYNITADLPQPPTPDHDYLSRNLPNLCMVYEEPLPSFYSHNKNNELDKLGCLSHTRWRHIHKIHCVSPMKLARSWVLNPF